ncbi:unnamed protein product [Linum tenue]|uniref:Uncharacterized protein n=1 Tax=Linum tenue TaxID=586396 RepID=A0AAV0LZ33_9ROSI|nr:unnamed protein product [Linum tenue]
MSQQHASPVVTVDELRISPPRGSVPATSLRLTLFDISWIICHPIQRVFFYDFPHSSSHFRQTTIPSLADSLSLALIHFYPLAARLVTPTLSDERARIFYSDGDSVSLTVAETGLQFDRVISDLPSDVELLHPLLPKLPPNDRPNSEGETSSPLLAVKVTLFPNSGICIGFEFRHVAADGLAFNHFVKSWASICKSGGGDLSWVEKSPPCHDRELIEEHTELENSILKTIGNYASHWDEGSRQRMLAGKVRATFRIDGEHIKRMKASLANHNGSSKQSTPTSAFTVASALLWTSLTKSPSSDEFNSGEDHIDCYVILVDCRGRLKPKLPATYSGNCLSGIQVLVKRSDLIGGNGFAIAARVIASKIREMEAEGPLRSAEKFFSFSGWQEIMKQGNILSVAGSPKLGVYETDFGWGNPRKSEPVHVDFSGSVYFSDARDKEKGGIEFGLALSKGELDAFAAAFEQQLRRFSE